MTGFLSPWHWLFIAVIALLLFGNRLPEVARSMGRSVKEFKRGLRDVSDEFNRDTDDTKPPTGRLQSPEDAQKLDDGSADRPTEQEEKVGERDGTKQA